MSDKLFTIINSDGTSLFYYKTRILTGEQKDPIHHYDELKFVRIESGSGIWQIGNKEYPVTSGDILLFSHADIRTVKQVDAPLRIAQFNFFPAAVYPRQNCTTCFYKRTEDFSNKLDTSHPSFKTVTAEFDAILDEISANRPYQKEAILTHLTHMVIATARMFTTSELPAQTTAHDTAVSTALEYIHAHLSAPLSLAEVAKIVGLSPAYFSRLFKAHVGFSFQDYVARTRVARVIDLLQDRSINVLDAAMEAGFNSSSGFYRTFTAVTGSTPKNFIK